jgi:hypothetical protein
MLAFRGSRGIAPLILNPGTWWRWVVSLPLGKETPVPSEYKSAWAPKAGLEILEKRINSYHCWAKPIIVQPIDQSLQWLYCTGSFQRVHFNLSIQVAFILRVSLLHTTLQHSHFNALTFIVNFYCCTVHSEIHIVHSPTNALFINLGKV